MVHRIKYNLYIAFFSVRVVIVEYFSYEYELLAVASSGSRNALKVHSNTLAHRHKATRSQRADFICVWIHLSEVYYYYYYGTDDHLSRFLVKICQNSIDGSKVRLFLSSFMFSN